MTQLLDRVFYGGMALSIFNNVQRAWEEPQAQVLALRQGAREARRFARRLNTMIYGLEGVLGEISGCDDHRRILSRLSTMPIVSNPQVTMGKPTIAGTCTALPASTTSAKPGPY